jgi:diguanylate cyclase (GGDEF)-like protein
MPVVRDATKRAQALLALHEALIGAEDDRSALERLAATAVAGLLGDAAGVWRLDHDMLDLSAFTFGTDDITDFVRRATGGRCKPEDSAMRGVVLAGEVLRVGPEGVGAVCRRVEQDYQQSVDLFEMTGLIAVPLESRGRCLGALAVARRTGSVPFEDEDVEFLQQLARVVSVTFANAQLLEEVAWRRRQADALVREDQLTGLLNRRGFVEVLRETALDRGTVVAVIDMDGFRMVNDGFGHAVGDMVLASLAARLCASLPPMTPVARIGGDEFAVLVQASSNAEADEIVQNAVRECTGTFQVVGLSVPVTISVGTAVPVKGGADQALQHADLAMSRAKRRNSLIAAYDPALDDPATRRLRDVLDLRREIRGDGLVVHYQPVVPVAPGPLRVEALVRRKVGDTLALPGTWLDTAARSGLLPDLTSTVVRLVIAQLGLWWAEGLEVECAVNVPAMVLAGPDLVRDLLTVVDEAGLPRRALSVEVTEEDLVGPQARDALYRCADADIAVAVDDFGTGWSSLAYLVELPLRTVKLDRSIITGVDVDERRVTVVRAAIDVAHDLGLRVVAEGIETQAVADVVIDLGADALQGFLYSRPAAPEDLSSLLRAGPVATRA